jgi:NADP-dependent 3-hydroxy acid dehydrogenase YdfG
VKTILITGASSGFGKATAELLAKKNYRLILVARRKDRLEKLQKNLKTEVYIAPLDVRKEEEVKTLFENLPDEFRSVDILINCAGLALGLNPVYSAETADWNVMIDTNIKGTLYCTRFALEGMVKRNSGLIITIGSIAATVPYKGGNVYGATKAFIKQFAKNLRTDLLGTNIKVTNIDPGAAETEFSLVRFKGNKKQADNVYKGMQPLIAEDIASTISWVIEQPNHVNIDNVEMWALDQTYGGIAFSRRETK